MLIYFVDVIKDLFIESMVVWVVFEIKGFLIVVGYFMGGCIVMEVMCQVLDWVICLVLVNIGYYFLKEGEIEKCQVKIDEGYVDFVGMIKGWLLLMMVVSCYDDIVLIDSFISMVLEIGFEVYEQQIKVLVNCLNVMEYLLQVSCFVLFLIGIEDVWLFEKQYCEIQEMVVDVEFYVVENVGYFLFVEQFDLMVEFIMNWLNFKEEE